VEEEKADGGDGLCVDGRVDHGEGGRVSSHGRGDRFRNKADRGGMWDEQRGVQRLNRPVPCCVSGIIGERWESVWGGGWYGDVVVCRECQNNILQNSSHVTVILLYCLRTIQIPIILRTPKTS